MNNGPFFYLAMFSFCLKLNFAKLLLKPFSLSRFLKACNKANEQYEQKKNNILQTPNDNTIFIKSGYEQMRVTMADILFTESNGNYMQFVLKDKKILSRLTMGETEAYYLQHYLFVFIGTTLFQKGTLVKLIKTIFG